MQVCLQLLNFFRLVHLNERLWFLELRLDQCADFHNLFRDLCLEHFSFLLLLSLLLLRAVCLVIRLLFVLLRFFFLLLLRRLKLWDDELLRCRVVFIQRLLLREADDLVLVLGLCLERIDDLEDLLGLVLLRGVL